MKSKIYLIFPVSILEHHHNTWMSSFYKILISFWMHFSSEMRVVASQSNPDCPLYWAFPGRCGTSAWDRSASRHSSPAAPVSPPPARWGRGLCGRGHGSPPLCSEYWGLVTRPSSASSWTSSLDTPSHYKHSQQVGLSLETLIDTVDTMESCWNIYLSIRQSISHQMNVNESAVRGQLPEGHRRVLHQRVVSRRRLVHPPVRFLLAAT